MKDDDGVIDIVDLARHGVDEKTRLDLEEKGLMPKALTWCKLTGHGLSWDKAEFLEWKKQRLSHMNRTERGKRLKSKREAVLNFIGQRGETSASEISKHFELSDATVRGDLRRWVSSGLIEKLGYGRYAVKVG